MCFALRHISSVTYSMRNSTSNNHSETMRERLRQVVGAYHGLLCADERRLHEAMLEFERNCLGESTRQIA